MRRMGFLSHTLNSKLFSILYSLLLSLFLIISYQNCGQQFSAKKISTVLPGNAQTNSCPSDIPNCVTSTSLGLQAIVKNGASQSIPYDNSVCGTLNPEQIEEGLGRAFEINLFTLNFVTSQYYCKRTTPEDAPLDSTYRNCNEVLRPDGVDDGSLPTGIYRNVDSENRHVILEFEQVLNGEYELHVIASSLNDANVVTEPIVIRYKIDDCLQ